MLPGLAAKYIEANVSVIRAICWASPGSLKLSKSSRVASAISFCAMMSENIDRIMFRPTSLKSNRPIKAFKSSRLSGFEMKSPRRRLSSLVQFLRKIARLRSLGLSGDRSLYISLFSSRKASPVFGLALKRAAPVKMSFFCDFVCRRDSCDGYSCRLRVSDLNRKPSA